MKIVYGIDIDINIDRIDYSLMEKLQTYTIDQDDQLFIVHTIHDVNRIQALLQPFQINYDVLPLYQLTKARTTTLFPDYGIHSEREYYYLYREITVPFQITGGEDIQMNMALLQIDEHLIAHDMQHGSSVYFVDRQYIELIKGYEKAYSIEVSFLDLDKTCKND